MKLVLPLPPNAANLRRHWRVALKEKQAHWQELDALLWTRQIPRPPAFPPSRAKVAATLYVWSYMDDDNAMHRLKPTMDWLVDNGYLAGDSRKHVEWAGLPEQFIDRKHPRLELVVESVE